MSKQPIKTIIAIGIVFSVLCWFYFFHFKTLTSFEKQLETKIGTQTLLKCPSRSNAKVRNQTLVMVFDHDPKKLDFLCPNGTSWLNLKEISFVKSKMGLCNLMAGEQFNYSDLVFYSESNIEIGDWFKLEEFMDKNYDLYAIASQSKIGSNGRWSENSLFFDSRFFGGTFKAVADLCQQLPTTKTNQFPTKFDSVMKQRTKNLKGNVMIELLNPSDEFKKVPSQFYKVDRKQSLDFELPIEDNRIDWELEIERDKEMKQEQKINEIVEKLEKHRQTKVGTNSKALFFLIFFF